MARVAPEAALREAGGGMDVLDPRARREIRERLAGLREDLEAAQACDDPGRAERAHAEIEALEEALASALGLGGRARQTGDATERARKAVYNRIRGVTRRLSEIHPELAAHLRHSIRTGRMCSYHPERATEWRVTSSAHR